VAETWGQPVRFTYLYRGEVLRPQVGTGHSITLGYLYMTAIGFWLYLRSTQTSKGANVRAFGLLILGLLFAYARGPWFATAILTLVFLAFEARNARHLLKACLVLIGIVAAVFATPFGATLMETLPFIGTLDQQAVIQRQQLAEVSWRLIQQHPFFGDPFVMLQMEELRSGAGGIIDLVNAYAQVALFYGLIGLSLFVGVFFFAILRAYAVLKRFQAANDVALVWLGASLIACMLASLALMATSGQLWLQWVSAALLVSYANLQYSRGPALNDLPFRGGALQSRAAATS
jgi:O-antigen ligase